MQGKGGKSMNLQAGDIVKHRKKKHYIHGTIKEISKTGKRAYVQFAKDDNPELIWNQVSYFQLEQLEKA
jgi:hypothetical protein